MNSKVNILGGAQTDFSRNWAKEGKNLVAILHEVIEDGIQNAGFDFDDIKRWNKENRVGCFVGNFIAEKYIGQGHLGAFLTEVDPSFYGVPSARYEAACASSSVAIDAAASKIMCGELDVAIVIGFELMKTVSSKEGGGYLGYAAYNEKECQGIEFPFPKLFGRLADHTIEKYRLDENRYMDSLALIADKNYENAKRNPMAQTRTWFMDLEQAKLRGTATNPLVGGRLAVSDCSQVTDGAALVVLASDELLRKLGANKPYLKGWGHRVAPLRFDKKIENAESSPFLLPWTRRTVLDAYGRSGLTVEDIDVFETHDCFTSSEYAAISCFGLSEPGREYEAIESGMLRFDGKKPMNPSGGLIGCGHPVGASGARMLLDCYKQVAGLAGAYQVENVRNAAMLNFGGSATTNYVYIVGV